MNELITDLSTLNTVYYVLVVAYQHVLHQNINSCDATKKIFSNSLSTRPLASLSSWAI